MALFRKDRTTVPPSSPKPVVEEAATPSFLRETEIRTSLAPDAVITGKLSFTTPTRIEGKLKGEVRCTSLLVVGVSAMVEGVAQADELRIEGFVRGDVVDSHRVTIGTTGTLIGRLRTEVLIVEDGGTFEGRISMRPDDARDRDAKAG